MECICEVLQDSSALVCKRRKRGHRTGWKSRSEKSYLEMTSDWERKTILMEVRPTIIQRIAVFIARQLLGVRAYGTW